jgi:hypothetical protein
MPRASAREADGLKTLEDDRCSLAGAVLWATRPSRANGQLRPIGGIERLLEPNELSRIKDDAVPTDNEAKQLAVVSS